LLQALITPAGKVFGFEAAALYAGERISFKNNELTHVVGNFWD